MQDNKATLAALTGALYNKLNRTSLHIKNSLKPKCGRLKFANYAFATRACHLGEGLMVSECPIVLVCISLSG